MDMNPRNGNSYDTVQPAYTEEGIPEQKKGFSVASLVCGILGIVGLCCCIGVIFAPFGIIFGIVALAKKQSGKGMAITGLVLGTLTVLICVSIYVSIRPMLKHMDVISADIVRLAEEQDTVFPAYDADGTLPDYLRKYEEGELKEMLDGCDITIYDLMDQFLLQYKKGSFPKLDSGAYFAVSVSQAAAFLLPAA